MNTPHKAPGWVDILARGIVRHPIAILLVAMLLKKNQNLT